MTPAWTKAGPRAGPTPRLHPRLQEALRGPDHPPRRRGRRNHHVPVHRGEQGGRPLRVRPGNDAHPGQDVGESHLRPARSGDAGPGTSGSLHPGPHRRRRHPHRAAALRAPGRPVPDPRKRRGLFRAAGACRLRGPRAGVPGQASTAGCRASPCRQEHPKATAPSRNRWQRACRC